MNLNKSIAFATLLMSSLIVCAASDARAWSDCDEQMLKDMLANDKATKNPYNAAAARYMESRNPAEKVKLEARMCVLIRKWLAQHDALNAAAQARGCFTAEKARLAGLDIAINRKLEAENCK